MRFARPLTIALFSLAGITAAQAATDTPRVDARQARQEARIAHGVADGSLTKAETRHLRHQQRHVRQAERHAKADGTVTAQERHRLHRLQDHASRSIHRQKHDAQVRPQSAG
ncbi:hypothetical protein [Pseudaquabacterium pictum]|uniref:DUF4148 domain-containing protein n=1 Tax=Pseudaquabacterium pictum TaxID=2315236 RepID=A0A480AXZ9_9BURK|nr:hypothetical protein [Rubrivivax pictus]GCL66233.1 hypothetical protein AQPW35_53140 [Rubrivivax pictus]